MLIMDFGISLTYIGYNKRAKVHVWKTTDGCGVPCHLLTKEKQEPRNFASSQYIYNYKFISDPNSV